MNAITEKPYLTIYRKSGRAALSDFYEIWNHRPFLSGQLVDVFDFECNIDIHQNSDGEMLITLSNRARSITSSKEINLTEEDLIDLLDEMCGPMGKCKIANPWFVPSHESLNSF